MLTSLCRSLFHKPKTWLFPVHVPCPSQRATLEAKVPSLGPLYHQMESGQRLTKNPEAEIKAETTEENCLMAYSKPIFSFYIVQAHLSKGSTAHTRLGTSYISQQSKIKCHTNMPTEQSDGRNSSVEVPSSQVTIRLL